VRPIVIAAGGTGGHFFPAEALAATLIARGHCVVLMTDARSGALKSAVFSGGETHVLPGAGIAGRGVARAVRAMAALARGTLRARQLLAGLDAGAIVGFGGYPSVPPILGAHLLRRRPPIMLHEQNAVLGRANRFLARHADRLALGFADTARIPAGVPTCVTGNPVRPAIQAVAASPYGPPVAGDIHLLVLGGSLGARVFSDVVPAAVAALPAELRTRLRIVQQCRAEDIARVRAAYDAISVPADLAPFFSDVAAQMVRAHLVISRAGASSCAEIAAVGRPAILVPLPGAIDDHQSANAGACGAAGVMNEEFFFEKKNQKTFALWTRHAGQGAHPNKQKFFGSFFQKRTSFSSSSLRSALEILLLSPGDLALAAQAAAECGKPKAAADLADAVENLMRAEAL
jgi:UDP-N-acetylglucosamine--N-acetylmuramyl-(pentapeptide) pyrophosphoryl-undecaprenol N-acetylglucosamine transferase